MYHRRHIVATIVLSPVSCGFCELGDSGDTAVLDDAASDRDRGETATGNTIGEATAHCFINPPFGTSRKRISRHSPL